MAQAKKMNEASYAMILKELDAVGEVIRTKQDEKQSVMDDFEEEKKRFSKGKISEATLASSVKKSNAELLKLDKEIRNAIMRAAKLALKAKDMAERQAPKKFMATLYGIRSGSAKSKNTKKASKKSAKKKTTKKKPMKKKSVRPSKSVLKKELALDKKFVKKR